MKIEQLEQLIKIVECGSMNTAAEEMYLARSSLSTSMKRLEEELGEPVFIRHSNGVNLTPFGSACIIKFLLFKGVIKLIEIRKFLIREIFYVTDGT